MPEQARLLELPHRPRLGVEYARCFVLGQTRVGIGRCSRCGKAAERFEQHEGAWLCHECHITSHGRG